MIKKIPLVPSTELVKQWIGEHFGCTVQGPLSDIELSIAAKAAVWGADQELDACCELITTVSTCGTKHQRLNLVNNLRAWRRPKYSTLAEEAMAELDNMKWDLKRLGRDPGSETIVRALERLQQLDTER